MKGSYRYSAVVALLCAAGVMVAGNEAQAAGNSVVELHLVKGSNGTQLVAVGVGGITIIDPKTLKTHRAWSSARKAMRGTTQDWFQTKDVDRNGVVDLVTLGSPTFIVTGDGNPLYAMPKGCDQVHLGDFGANNTMDLLCRKGNGLVVTTYDGQKLLDYKIAGLKLGICRFGDANGDLKDDVECEIKGKGQFVRIDVAAGKEIGRQFESATLDDVAADPDGLAGQVASYLDGSINFDLNGDGTREESLLMDGNAIVVRSRSKKTAQGRHETGKITSVLVEDINGDNKPEIVLGGEGKVFVISHEGKMLATITADPKKLRRRSDVRITGLNANALEDSSNDATQKVVDKSLKKLSGCYDSNVKRDPYTRVGRLIWNLTIDDKGGVKKVERLHSDLNDKKVEGCVSKALKGLKFSKAKGPGASVTLTLEMGFVDQ